jgi:selenide,water dikinase
VVDGGQVPLLDQAETLVRAGRVTGASGRNWASYGHAVTLPAELPEWRRQILADPQTSGGLLIACAPGEAEDLLRSIRAANYGRASLIGRVEAGPAAVRVEAEIAAAASFPDP